MSSKPTKPLDVLVTNGWFMNIPFPGINNDAHFDTLSGINKSTGTVEIVDAGTNHKFKFGDQIISFDDMTLTRPYDGSNTDKALEELVDLCMSTGYKFACVAVKLHWGNEVFRVTFEGFRFTNIQLPDMDLAGTEAFKASYGATCDDWEIIRV